MNIENFRLDSAKILDNKIFVEYHTDSDSAKRTYEKTVKERPPHPHFKNALRAFIPHYDLVFHFEDRDSQVKGISVNNKEQVQLIGMIDSVNGSMCSLNTPFISKDSDNPQFDIKEIDMHLENVRIEAWNFIFKGKTSEPEMEFPEEDNKAKKVKKDK